MSAVASPALRQPAVDIFDARHYAEVRKPLAEASTLPPWAYTSEEFYRREVQTIWMKEWNFFGRADRIPNPGDYFSVDFVGVPIVVFQAAHPPLVFRPSGAQSGGGTGAELPPGGVYDTEFALRLSFHRHYLMLGEHYNSVFQM